MTCIFCIPVVQVVIRISVLSFNTHGGNCVLIELFFHCWKEKSALQKGQLTKSFFLNGVVLICTS